MDSVLIENRPHHWVLQTTALYDFKTVNLYWNSFLPEDLGTKHQRAYMLKSAKQLLMSLIKFPRSRSRNRLSGVTVQNWFDDTKRLVTWMFQNGIWRFSELEIEDAIIFLQSRRPQRSSDSMISVSRRKSLIELFSSMWQFRGKYVASISFNVDLHHDEICAQVPVRDAIKWKGVPEEDALALMKAASKWIRIYDEFLVNFVHGLWSIRRHSVGLTKKEMQNRSKDYCESFSNLPDFLRAVDDLGMKNETALRVLQRLVSATEGAAAILLLFTIGFRISELAALDKNCIDIREIDGEAIPYVRGILAKRGGTSKAWVAGGEAAYIVDFLNRLYGPVVDKKDGPLFIRRNNRILPLPSSRIDRRKPYSFDKFLDVFLQTAYCKAHSNVSHMHPHQARKTFARLAVKRDKSMLDAICHHLGHVLREFTDGVYVQSIDFEELLDAANREELASALLDIFNSKHLAGRGAENINSLRFHGKTVMVSTVEKMIKNGVNLAPCNWGYCLYSQQHSACMGSKNQPNEKFRSPDTCGNCKNFVVADVHRSFWNRRYEDHVIFLKSTLPGSQAALLVERRINQCRELLCNIKFEDAKAK